MEKQLALTFILVVQPVFAYLLWFAMDKLFTKLMPSGTMRIWLALAAAVVLYGIFAYFFADGFLKSPEASRLGF